MNAPFVLFAEEAQLLQARCGELCESAYANAVFLIDRDGQLLAQAGVTDRIDVTSLASLAAGNVAATDGLAQLIGEEKFPVQFHEGERESIHISQVGARFILIVLFDQRSSVGLVRLRVRKAQGPLLELFEQVRARSQSRQESALPALSDDEIDNLFSDS